MTKKGAVVAKKTKTAKRGKPKWRQILADIDNVLAKDGPNAIKLWAVLTALRGPDDRDEEPFKEKTTAVIRTKALPQTARSKAFFVARFAPAGQRYVKPYVRIAEEDHDRSSHFCRHANHAARVLGLLKDNR